MVQTGSDPTGHLFQRQHPSAAQATDAGSLAPAFELVPGNYFTPLDLGTVFSRPAPLEVDLGCGDGSFLVALAEKFPERNFLGIERMLGRVRTTCRRVARHAVDNVRVLRVETAYAVEYLLPPGSANVAHLLFPDPWPKKKHQRRRIVTKDFLTAVHRLLAPDGCLNIATDQADYFEAIGELAAGSAWAVEALNRDATFPLTTFEKRFLAVGVPIYRLGLRRVA